MAALKRKNEAITEDGAPYNKRTRPSLGNSGTQDKPLYDGGATTSRADYVTGQRQAFPGLDDDDNEDEEQFYGPANDGMDYLKMVRTEAQGIPIFFTSAERTQSEPDDHRGWYSDGAYVARPILGPQIPSSFPVAEEAEARRHRRNTSSEGSNPGEDDEVSEVDDLSNDGPLSIPRTTQSIYHDRLISAFETQRDNLHEAPPEDLVSAASSSGLLISQADSKASLQLCLSSTTPTPVQLALMDVDMVLRALKIIVARILRPRREVGMCTSVWIWGLLARLAGWMGQLSKEDISIARDLAKRARDWGSPDADGQDGDEENDEKDERDDGKRSDGGEKRDSGEEDDGVEKGDGAGKGDGSGQDVVLQDSDGKETSNTRVTLDMIITVVGEIFGQRDILSCREVW